MSRIYNIHYWGELYGITCMPSAGPRRVKRLGRMIPNYNVGKHFNTGTYVGLWIMVYE
jgi:hypothetical protein